MSESWADRLKVNDLFDIFDFQYKSWLIGKVVDIAWTKIKVHFCGWNERFDEWREKTDFLDSEQIAALHTHTIPCSFHQFNCAAFALCRRYIITDPESKSIYYHNRTRTTISKFDFAKQECVYAGTGVQNDSAVAFDGDSISFIPYYLDKSITTSLVQRFDKKSHKFKDTYLENVLDSNQIIISFIYSPFDNHFHLFHYDKNCDDVMHHISYFKTAKWFTKVRDRSLNLMISDLSRYKIKASNMDKNICKSNTCIQGNKIIHVFNPRGYIWEVKEVILYDLETGFAKNLNFPAGKAAYCRSRMASMVVYDEIFLMFTKCCIWCYDCKLDKWFKQHRAIPMPLELIDCIDFKDNYLHCFMNIGHHTDNFVANDTYIKLDLFDIIPNDLIKQRWDTLDNKLINGFVNECINKYDVVDMYPLNLNELISMYFPPFLYH